MGVWFGVWGLGFAVCGLGFGVGIGPKSVTSKVIQEWFVHSPECYLRRNALQVILLVRELCQSVSRPGTLCCTTPAPTSVCTLTTFILRLFRAYGLGPNESFDDAPLCKKNHSTTFPRLPSLAPKHESPPQTPPRQTLNPKP